MQTEHLPGSTPWQLLLGGSQSVFYKLWREQLVPGIQSRGASRRIRARRIRALGITVIIVSEWRLLGERVR